MPGQICPWCTTENDEDATTCRSCGAALVARAGTTPVPGVTIVDPIAATDAAGDDLVGEPARDIAIETALHTITHTI